MGRNIVLFSDGTGNKGGTGSETNVFKLYNDVKGGKNNREQFVYYDNGVGTSTQAAFRAIGGATGLGFRRNVRDLYEFAARHYRSGADIYGFGFSRGAATMRAFAGMVHHCGLVQKHFKDVDGEETELEEDDFQDRVDSAMATYKRRKEGDEPERGARIKVDIEFLGLWDSVAALGFPQLPWLDSCINSIRRHKFYDYAPSGTVKHVFHAVAIDDERRTFWPLIWDEEKFKGTYIEQVWFSGVHSNVGGGYPRSGLANVTLKWMIERIKGHAYSLDEDDRGLILNSEAVDAVRDKANPHGKLYDSRGGLALFYRFQPRPIERLCAGDNKPHRGPAKKLIHDSVFDRMEHRTAGYAPGRLPTGASLAWQ